MHFGDRIVSSFSGSRGAGFAPGAADSGPVADARAAATVAVGRCGCGHNDGGQLKTCDKRQTRMAFSQSTQSR